MAGTAIPGAEIGMITIIRCTFGDTTTHMTGLAQRGSRGIVIHNDSRPTWITVTGFTTAQSGMVRRAELIGRVTTGDPAARNNTAVIKPGTREGRG